jgi:hypothetical protein
VVEVLQTAQGAIFPIADAVKIILENRADIDQWFPKGSRTVRVGARAKSTASNYLIPRPSNGTRISGGVFSRTVPDGNRNYFLGIFPMTRFEATPERRCREVGWVAATSGNRTWPPSTGGGGPPSDDPRRPSDRSGFQFCIFTFQNFSVSQKLHIAAFGTRKHETCFAFDNVG